MKPKFSYIYSADAVRVVGAFAVVCIHVTDALIVLPNHFGGMSWWFANVINAFSRIAVPLFIMLSGYLLLDREKLVHTRSFIRKRLLYVGIPLLVWTLAYFFWYLIFFLHPFTISDVVMSVWTVSVFHLHFLIIILGLYLLTPVLKSYTDTISTKKLLIVFLGWSCLSILIGLGMYVFPPLRVLKNMIIVPILFGCYYLYGQYIRRITFSLIQRYLFLLLFIVLGLLTAGLVYFDMKMLLFAKGFGEYFQDPLSLNILVMSYLIFPVLMQMKTRFSEIVKHLAATTFGIYLIHPMIIDIVNRYLPLNIHQMSHAIWFFLGLKILLVFGISYVVVLVYKKAVEWLHGII